MSILCLESQCSCQNHVLGGPGSLWILSLLPEPHTTAFPSWASVLLLLLAPGEILGLFLCKYIVSVLFFYLCIIQLAQVKHASICADTAFLGKELCTNG